MNIFQKIIIGIVVFAVLFLSYVTLDANKYQATVRIVEGEGRVGVNPTTERLDFGDLSPGTTLVRQVTLENNTGIPMYIFVLKTGSIGDLIKINKNNFTLAGGEQEEIEFANYIPASAQIDAVYTGRVYIFRIPTFGL